MKKFILIFAIVSILCHSNLFPTDETHCCKADITKLEKTTDTSEFISERIVPMKLKYIVHADLAGNTFEYTMNRNIKRVSYKKKKALKIVTVTNNPTGKTVDTFFIDKFTLSPLKRIIDQGNYDIDLEYSDNLILGTIKGSGKIHKIRKELLKPVIADGSGVDIIISALPLELNYSKQFQLFEFQTSELKDLELKVIEKTKLKIKNTMYTAYKASLIPPGNNKVLMTIYLNTKKPYVMLKSELSFDTQSGPGKVITELEQIKY